MATQSTRSRRVVPKRTPKRGASASRTREASPKRRATPAKGGIPSSCSLMAAQVVPQIRQSRTKVAIRSAREGRDALLTGVQPSRSSMGRGSETNSRHPSRERGWCTLPGAWRT